MSYKPLGWRTATLGEVTFEHVVRRADTSQPSGPVYGVDRHVGLTPAAKYTASDLSKYKMLPRRFFAYNPMRLNIGSIAFCHREFSPGFVSPDYIVFGCREDQLLPEFLNYWRQGPLWKAFFAGAGVGSVRERIYYPNLARLPMTIPPVAEQAAIVSVLDALDDRIGLSQRMNQILESIARTIFKSWFVDLDPVRAKAGGQAPRGIDAETASLFPSDFEESEDGRIPQGWKRARVDDVLELAYGKALKETERVPGSVVVMGSNGPVGSHVQKLVNGPGIVVGRKGNPGTVRWVDQDFFPIDTTFYVISREQLPLSYLYFALEGCNLPSLAADSAVPGLNRNFAYSCSIMVPPRKIVRAFDEVFTALRSEVSLNLRAASTLTELRDTLLPRLISGQLRVPEAQELVEEATAP